MNIIKDYKYVYRIDDKDVITFVDQDWLQFAQENDAPDLTSENVIGSNLLDFVPIKVVITYCPAYIKMEASSLVIESMTFVVCKVSLNMLLIADKKPEMRSSEIIIFSLD